ncbi:MAG: hypothetical protein U9R04_00785 [Chloroflexota bacterium]|nr:hypothetical protein [Chloroflexota bacterium]
MRGLVIKGWNMKILRMLETLITVRGLGIILLGKEVTISDGASLGIVSAREQRNSACG